MVAALAAAKAVADRKLASSAVSASDFSDFKLTAAVGVDTVICVTRIATPSMAERPINVLTHFFIVPPSATRKFFRKPVYGPSHGCQGRVKQKNTQLDACTSNCCVVRNFSTTALHPYVRTLANFYSSDCVRRDVATTTVAGPYSQ